MTTFCNFVLLCLSGSAWCVAASAGIGSGMGGLEGVEMVKPGEELGFTPQAFKDMTGMRICRSASSIPHAAPPHTLPA